MNQKSGSKSPLKNSMTPSLRAAPAGCGHYSPMTPKGAKGGKSAVKKKAGSKQQ